MTTAGAANRRRGADAERAVVAFMRQNGWPDARRYLAGDSRQPGDIDAIPGLVIEVKDQATACWPAWCRQAAQEAGPDRAWVVVRRERGKPYVGMWPCVVPRPWCEANVAGLAALVVRKLRGDFGQALSVDAPFATVMDGDLAVIRFWRVLDALKATT